MIETPQWLARLAERVEISYENAKELQKSFATLTSNRLSKGLDAVLPFVGRLSTTLRHEFVAELPDGSKYIVPPRIVLVLSPYEGTFPGLPGEVLIESSPLTEEAVRNFLQASGELLAEYIASGETVFLTGIGAVAPPEQEGYKLSFAPAPTLLDALNTPFATYEVVPLSEGKEYPQLSRIAFDHREAIDKIAPLHPKKEKEKGAKPLPEPEIPPKGSTQDDAPHTKVEIPPEGGKQARQTNPQAELPPPMPPSMPEEPARQPSSKRPPALPSSRPSPAEPPALPSTQPTENVAETPTKPAEDAKEEPQNGGEWESEEKRETQRKARGWLPILLIILVVAFFVGVALFFYSEATHTEVPKRKPKQRTEKTEEAPHKTAVPDTLTRETETVIPKNTAPSPPQYITVQPHERLVDIALREYGYKSFWVYIYEENREAIANPDRVPPGTRLRLPDKKQYGIDKTSTSSRATADSLQLQYNRRKGRA